MEEKELMSIKGNDGRLIVFENYVYFERKSIIGHLDTIFSGSNKSYYNEKKIPYEMINGVEWNKASTWRNGYISLAVEGEIKNENGLKGAVKNATSIIFFPKSNDDATKCVDFITEKIKNQTLETKNAAHMNQADELIKFKKMFDEGIITEEEFNKVKEKIINNL